MFCSFSRLNCFASLSLALVRDTLGFDVLVLSPQSDSATVLTASYKTISCSLYFSSDMVVDAQHVRYRYGHFMLYFRPQIMQNFWNIYRK